MSKKALIKKLANENKQKSSDFIKSWSIDDIVDLEIELLRDF